MKMDSKVKLPNIGNLSTGHGTQNNWTIRLASNENPELADKDERIAAMKTVHTMSILHHPHVSPCNRIWKFVQKLSK